MKKNSNVIRMPHRFNFNAGYLVFLIVILYLIISVVMYLTDTAITIYQVNTGSLALENIYEGFIIRDEEIVKAEYSGTIDYYVSNGDKADASSVICSIDESGHVSELLKKFSDTTLKDSDVKSVKDALSEFTVSYSDKNFSSIYAVKDNIISSLSRSYYDIILDDLDRLIEESGNTTLFHKLHAEHPGIIMMTVDGYEYMTEDMINSGIFDTSVYKSENLRNNTIINRGDDIYRLINSDKWYIIIQLNKSEAEELADADSVNIRFMDNGLTAEADFEIIRTGDMIYGKISLSRYMINFADKRYVRIELTEKAVTGLKIPVSSVLSKSFYTIPKSFKTDSDSFIRISYTSSGEIKMENVETTIYHSDENYYYVSMDDFNSGDIIEEADTGERYIVGTMGELMGVYCVNRGYAVFKRINIIDKNNEYYIIEKGSSNGLNIYDHIVLDHKTVKENELVN